MPDVLLRGLADSTHRELKRLAKAHGRSVNAEIVALLDQSASSEPEVGLGTEMHEFAMRFGGFEPEIERDKTPAGRVTFE